MNGRTNKIMNEKIGQDGKHPLNRTKEVSVNVVPSVDANKVSSKFGVCALWSLLFLIARSKVTRLTENV